MPELRLRRRRSNSPIYNLDVVISMNKMVHEKKQKATGVCSYGSPTKKFQILQNRRLKQNKQASSCIPPLNKKGDRSLPFHDAWFTTLAGLKASGLLHGNMATTLSLLQANEGHQTCN
ncbi:hypothetical protein M0R45_007002 [Rubus argutus]|uniref:Uncharacterized protein n=1 Tax=Rubus argutus TaxID=59490 RepID=A0AAW1YSD8_RUBAR